MTARPWMPFYVGDYLSATGHLSTTEHGAYMLLILHYWRNKGLPDDDERLARITKLPLRIWQDIRPTIQDFFFDGWKHERIEFELTEAARTSAAARRAGKASGEVRRAKKLANDRSTPAERSLNDNPNESPTPTVTVTESISEAKASGGEPPSGGPVYTDSKHELWGEGVAILGQFGIPTKSAKPNIGRWLRDAKDDAQAVLSAIQRARDHRVIDPIPWITQALGGPNGHANRNSGTNPTSGKRQPNTNSVLAGMAQVVERRMRVHDEREGCNTGEPNADPAAA